MKIEVITIGDEILSGQVVDTNFAWLGDQLWGRGYDLQWHSTVADDPEQIGKALHLAAARSDVVMVTGGLGPTTDDITLEAVAQAFGLPLVLNLQALKEIEAFFEKFSVQNQPRQWRGVEGEAPSPPFPRRGGGGDASPNKMSPNNRRQAMLPRGSQMISNRVGTAPGVRLRFQKTEFFFLPGVPKEMKQQFEDALLPFLEEVDRGRAFFQKTFRCFGLPEATLDQNLRGSSLGPVRLGWRVVFPEILIKISSTNPTDGQRLLEEAEKVIREKIGPYIYAEGEETIERLLGRLLERQKETLAVAESCTGGLIAHLLTNVVGSSSYFERGVVAYSNAAKMNLVGVDPQLIKKYGAVSKEVAIAMAEGVRKTSGTTYGIGVTGIAGPGGGTPQKPVGTVHIAVASRKETREKSYLIPRDREWFKLLASHIALHKLRRMILS